MYEQFMGEYTDRDSASRQVQLFTVIYKLREFSSNQPSLHLLYFSTYSGMKNSLPYPKHILRAHCISMISCNSHVGMFIKPIFYFAVRKFVCKPIATTNIYGRKYRIQGQFSKSLGKCSSHFASHILGLSA